MGKRIGILTGGGDCPGLNAVIRAVVKHASGSYGWDVVGIEDSFKGLYEERYVDLPRERVRGLLDRGGTILGSSNRANPFAFPVQGERGAEEIRDVSKECMAHFEKLELEGLIVVGGDGTMGMAQGFQDLGMPVVGVPKTIDNDLEATDFTVGYQTAVDVATAAIDRLHSTAESHDRVIICEVMGRYAGWIALNAGLSSGAEIILIPEIEYDIETVIAAVDRRVARGISFSIAVVAEGALPRGGEHAVATSGDKTQQDRLGGAGQRLATSMVKDSPYDVRVTVLGHIQRGGAPCAFDRLLATRFGVMAVDLLAKRQFGQVTAIRGGELVSVPLELAVRKLKRVDPEGGLVAAARSLGVSLG